MRKGNGLKFNGHDYGILFCGTDGSLMLDRGGYEIIPDKVGPALRHQAGPRRPAAPQDRPQARDRPRASTASTPHVRELPRLPQVASRRPCDIEIAPPLDQHVPPGNIAYKLGRKLDWDADTETFKNDPEANALLKREPRKGYELPNV